MAKNIELLTGYSLKKVRNAIWKILDIELTDNLTGRKFTKRMDTSGEELKNILAKLNFVDNSNFRVLEK